MPGNLADPLCVSTSRVDSSSVGEHPGEMVRVRGALRITLPVVRVYLVKVIRQRAAGNQAG